MSTEVKVAHSKVVSPQNQSARISEIPQSPNGTNQASHFYEGKRIVYDRGVTCEKRIDQVERRRGTPGQQRKINISSLAEYNNTQVFRPALQEQRASQPAIHHPHVIPGQPRHQLIQQQHSRVKKVSVEFEPRFSSNTRTTSQHPNLGSPTAQVTNHFQPINTQSQQEEGDDEKDAIIDELTNQVAHLIEENKNLAFENENLQTQLSQNMQSNHQVQLDDQQFQDQLAQQDQFINEQQNEIEMLNQEIQNLQQDLNQRDYEIQNLQQQNNEGEAESNDALISLIENLKTENQALRDELQTQETANDHILHLEQAIAKRDESHKILEDRLEELNTINSNLHEYLGRLLAKLNENSDGIQGGQQQQEPEENDEANYNDEGIEENPYDEEEEEDQE